MTFFYFKLNGDAIFLLSSSSKPITANYFWVNQNYLPPPHQNGNTLKFDQANAQSCMTK